MKRYGVAAVVGLVVLAAAGTGQPSRRADRGWRDLVADRVAAYGHRNWIVVSDAAYPAPSRPGVELVVVRAGQQEVLKVVLDELNRAGHVRPIAYQDAELAFVPERDATGIAGHRRNLKDLLSDLKPQPLPHDQLLDRVDKAADRYQVLLLKTDTMLPYTTVFLELDAGYWPADAERRLREAMKGPGK